MKKNILIVVGVLILVVMGGYFYQKDSSNINDLKLEVIDKKPESVDENVSKFLTELKKSYEFNSTEEKKEITKFARNTAAIMCVMEYDNIENINKAEFNGEGEILRDFYGKDIEYELLPYASEDGVIQYVSYKYFDKKKESIL